MPDDTPLDDVLGNRVGEVVQSFVDDGAIKVVAQKKPNGKWVVTATKPNA